jgi:uncharacterized membrane protein YedE/YeeE
VSPATKRTLIALGIGLWMGGALTAVGFADADEVRKMMRLQDLRLHETFICGAGLAALVLTFFFPAARSRGRRVRARTVVGAALFGIGWGLSFACPAGAIVQFASGQAPAVFTLLAIGAGILIADACTRHFRWANESCDSD